MKQFVFLFFAIVLEVIGTTGLKASEQFSKLIPTVITLVAYASAFYFLSVAMKTVPMGIAYAIWSGVGIVLISLIGFLFFKQSLDTPALLGLTLIVVGVLVINIFSKSVSH